MIGRSPSKALSGAPATVEDIAAGSTSSGTRVISIAGCCAEFNAYGIWGRFPGGPKRLVRVRIGAETSLAEAPMVVRSSEGHGAERQFLSAEVPVPGAVGGRLPPRLAAVEVVGAAGVVGGARRTAHPPTVRLHGITAAARLGRGPSVRVRWRVRDVDGDRLTATLEYSRNDGRRWSVLWSGPNRASVTVASALLAGSRSARLRVRVSDGFDEGSSTSPRFISVGRPPRVRILSPRPRATVRTGTRLALVAIASDDRLAPIPSRRIRWYDGRRALRTGANVSVPALRPGTHRLRVIATDARRRRGSARVTIRVRATAPRIVLSTIPARIARTARRLRLRIATSQRARLTASGASLPRRRHLGTSSTRARTFTIPIRATAEPVRIVLRATTYGRTSTLRVELPRG